ncbi:hypothetical protein PRIPAC_80541 [Pristionchus pacificus]|uniref:G protein-coupled receptor n=1 Tax=Pristionchus pacificus TaxID=54126 RepID=A0A2A6CJ96_PRIPA|nr:hypothetical protein PRIPAC_80541 [Pristionchus pacificus]|eukprot:PDM78180.1 G protein-coupled receptor [Pristionchus pacificus]
MDRPGLVWLNSTRTALAPTIFNAIFATEILLNVIAYLSMPFVSEAIYYAGGSDSPKFSYPNSIRDSDIFVGYVREVHFVVLRTIRPAIEGIWSFALERSVATRFWKWYASESTSTLLVVFFIEFLNIFFAAANSTGWMLGYWDYRYNASIMIATAVTGFVMLMIVYTYNRRQLRAMSTSRSEYSVTKTFQIRENCRIIECLISLVAPAGSATVIGITLACYFVLAPAEWELTRYVAIGLFDVFVALLCLFFFYLALHMDSELQRQFNNMRVIAALRRKLGLKPPIYRKSKLKTAHNEQPGSEATTLSYFNQLNASWMR